MCYGGDHKWDACATAGDTSGTHVLPGVLSLGDPGDDSAFEVEVEAFGAEVLGDVVALAVFFHDPPTESCGFGFGDGGVFGEAEVVLSRHKVGGTGRG